MVSWSFLLANTTHRRCRTFKTKALWVAAADIRVFPSHADGVDMQWPNARYIAGGSRVNVSVGFCGR